MFHPERWLKLLPPQGQGQHGDATSVALAGGGAAAPESAYLSRPTGVVNPYPSLSARRQVVDDAARRSLPHFHHHTLPFPAPPPSVVTLLPPAAPATTASHSPYAPLEPANSALFQGGKALTPQLDSSSLASSPPDNTNRARRHTLESQSRDSLSLTGSGSGSGAFPNLDNPAPQSSLSHPQPWSRPDSESSILPRIQQQQPYDFSVSGPGSTAVTPRAPTLVLVGEDKSTTTSSNGTRRGIGEADRAAVNGLLGLGALSAPTTTKPLPDISALINKSPFSAATMVGGEPLESLSGSDSEDAEGEEDYEETLEQSEGLVRGRAEHTTGLPPAASRGGATSRSSATGSNHSSSRAPPTVPRPFRRGRKNSSTTNSVSHSSEAQSLTTPPTRSPSPTFTSSARKSVQPSPPTEGEDPVAGAPESKKDTLSSDQEETTTNPLKRSLSGPHGPVSSRTTALPNKRRYRTSTTSGSGSFRCLHPSPDGGSPCPVSFRRSYDLARHRESKHGDGARAAVWRCKSCGGEFARKDSLQRHASNKGHDAGV
ncbi:hypothetical protein T439DRAFT_379878 [Meredithblackwellia eburnea MCA 4105]